MQEPAQPTQQSPHQSATSNPNQQQELVMPPIDLASRYGPNSSAIKLVIEIEFIHLVSFQFSSFYNNQFVTSNQQTNNLVFPNFFSRIFFSWAVEKENEHFMGLKLRENLFWTNKSLLSFSTAQTEISLWKNWLFVKLIPRKNSSYKIFYWWEKKFEFSYSFLFSQAIKIRQPKHS